jgi:hypothetical protein
VPLSHAHSLIKGFLFVLAQLPFRRKDTKYIVGVAQLL